MKNIEMMTMTELLETLNTKVDEYNLSEDAKERISLAVEHKTIVQKYNELSLLTTYSECLKADFPIKELAERYYYDTINVKDASHTEMVDGVPHTTVTRGVVEGQKKMNLEKFIEWTEECNNCVAADKRWRTHSQKARKVVEDQWKAFFASKKDTHSMSIGKTKKALQAMFDALLVIKSEKGNNAIVANGDIAKWVLGFANVRKDSKVDGVVTITGSVMSRQQWATLQMDALHKAVTGKDFEIFYGEPEEDVEVEVEEETK